MEIAEERERRWAHNAFLHMVAAAICDLESHGPGLAEGFLRNLELHRAHMIDVIPREDTLAHVLLGSWHEALGKQYRALREYLSQLTLEEQQAGYTSRRLYRELLDILDQDTEQ